jgi:hypothetical protein
MKTKVTVRDGGASFFHDDNRLAVEVFDDGSYIIEGPEDDNGPRFTLVSHGTDIEGFIKTLRKAARMVGVYPPKKTRGPFDPNAGED